MKTRTPQPLPYAEANRIYKEAFSDHFDPNNPNDRTCMEKATAAVQRAHRDHYEAQQPDPTPPAGNDTPTKHLSLIHI